MSDNSNNVHFSGVRFIRSPYLAIKSAHASLGPIMARCGPKMNIIVIFECFLKGLSLHRRDTTEFQQVSVDYIARG